MRSICTIFLLFWVLSINAQKASTFREVLKTAKEISIPDSFIYFDYSSLNKFPLDTTTGNKLFHQIYPNENQSFRDAEYFIAGKITLHKSFDILLLCAEKLIITNSSKLPITISPDPTTINSYRTKDLFFVLLDKEGNYQNKFLAAMDYRKKDFDKNITRKVSSWVYTDLRIIQHSVTDHWSSYLVYLPFAKNNTKEYSYSMEYRINDYGVFVAYPKFKSN